MSDFFIELFFSFLLQNKIKMFKVVSWLREKNWVDTVWYEKF